MCPVGVYPVGNLESCRIVLEHRQIAEFVAIWVEEPIVEDGITSPLDPLTIRQKVGLSRLTFDKVPKRVLALVGSRQIKLIEDEQARSNEGCRQQHRNDNAVDADASRFNCRDLVAAGHQAKGDQDGQQHAQWSNVVDEKRRNVQKIFAHDQGRDAITQDVPDQLEQSKHQEQHQERTKNQHEIKRKIPQNQIVEQHGKSCEQNPATPGCAIKGIMWVSVRCGQKLAALLDAGLQAPPNGAEPGGVNGPALHAPKQNASADEK